MQGAFETHEVDDHAVAASDAPEANKRSRLDAVPNNAPWKNLLPANDKETQQRMQAHRESVAKYTAATDEQRKQIPRVSPYPESPDAIFPGTPCYRINVNGNYVYVFVIDSESDAFTVGWDGKPRPQQAGYWIVPHFIYRDANDVEECKKRWQKVYDENASIVRRSAPLPPPNKTDFTSATDQHDCYYSPAVDNQANPPPMKDPLYNAPFNTNPKCTKHIVLPFPYNQNKSEYPQRAKPTLVAIPSNQRKKDQPHRTHFDPHPSLLEVIPPSYSGRGDRLDRHGHKKL